jgi:holliday junction DNA helicase RuvA
MIALLDGRLRDLEPGLAIIEAGGVGYEVRIPLSAFHVLQGRPNAVLHVHTHVREDQISLFGFPSPRERDTFRALIGVSGVGPRIALAVLSGLTPDDLAAAVEGDEWRRLAGVPGIGKRTAERLVLELKGRLQAPAPATAGRIDAISALVNLGYPQRAAEEAVADVLREVPGSDLGELLRRSLKLLVR